MNMLRKTNGIEDRFFDTDHHKRVTTIYLHYDKTSDLFDDRIRSKMPITEDDLIEKIKTIFEMIPSHHKLRLDITIDDAQGYTIDQLMQIFEDNILLEYKTSHRETNRKIKIAFALINAGIFAFILMIGVGHFLPETGLLDDIFYHVSDIAATVTIWEAMTMLLVQVRQAKIHEANLISRFEKVCFHTGK